MHAYFDKLDAVRYEGLTAQIRWHSVTTILNEVILGKTMAEHLRFAACYWHTFCWNGNDMFGPGSFVRPWQQPGNELELAKAKPMWRSNSSKNSTCLITASMTWTCRRKAHP